MKTEIQIHRFVTSGEAYAASQSDDNISDGDVLVCSDGVVGFLAKTWPIAVSEYTGAFHRAAFHRTATSRWMFEGESYLDSARLAMQITPWADDLMMRALLESDDACDVPAMHLDRYAGSPS